MKKTTFKIRRKIILAFLFCFLSVLVFAILSFQIHREIGYRLRLVEVADDLNNNILEVRRFEKNFFLHKDYNSLIQAMAYADRVEALYLRNESHILRLTKDAKGSPFLDIVSRYKETLKKIQSDLEQNAGTEPSHLAEWEESLRITGQNLLEMAGAWARTDRARIERLFQWALLLFIISMLFFGAVGVFVAFYISRLLTRPLIQMQQAMEKIAKGDFTPIPADLPHSEEFAQLFMAFNRMIHELEERQEQLIQARKISAIGTFTSGIAHELNNPVNNIVLTADALKEDFLHMNGEEALAMIQDILVQSERASEIIKNLLDFSRSERPEVVSISISSVINDTLRLVRNQLLLAGVEEVIELTCDLPQIYGEYKSLQQVFLNLFINAIQAMPEGGKLLIRSRISGDREWVSIDVSDTGIGIDPENIADIFDPFFTTKEVGKGTGLGLSVSYNIIRKHGGSIEVDSEPGRGTTFTVNFPTNLNQRIPEFP